MAAAWLPPLAWGKTADEPDRSPAATGHAGREADPVEQKLQAFLLDAKKRLGRLEPWQNRIFDDEVLTESRRFIRDYRASQNGVEAQADMDSIRKYLQFYGPKTLKKEKGTIVVAYLPARSCPKCVTSAPVIRTLLRERLENRGLTVIWANPRELSAESRDPRVAIDALATEKKAVGSLLVEAGPAPVDSIDAAHEEDQLFRIKSTLSIHDPALEAKEQQQLDLLDNGDFERSESKLLTDAFTDLGDQLEQRSAGQSDTQRGEVLVEVSGFGDYNQYSHARDQITQALQGTADVEEQRVSRGKAVFAVYTDAGLDKVRSSLGAMDPVTTDNQMLKINLAK